VAVVTDGHEEIESIPWSELDRAVSGNRRRALYVAAGTVAALSVGMVVARAVWTPSDPPAVASTLAPPTVVTEPIVTQVETTIAPILYDEAELVAVPLDDGARTAVARAEWFVTDYFTADLEPNGTADLRGALPTGVDLPEMPQDGVVGLSYVEWTRAYRVAELGSNRFRVDVVFRLLGAPRDEGFRRLPARAVSVAVEVNEGGGSVVVDLPAPAAVPAGPDPLAWAPYDEDPPGEVIDGAMALAAGFGSEHRLVGASPIAGGWRVVLTGIDEVGNRWPLAVWVDERGLPLG
jgi:hypothetical protein